MSWCSKTCRPPPAVHRIPCGCWCWSTIAGLVYLSLIIVNKYNLTNYLDMSCEYLIPNSSIHILTSHRFRVMKVVVVDPPLYCPCLYFTWDIFAFSSIHGLPPLRRHPHPQQSDPLPVSQILMKAIAVTKARMMAKSFPNATLKSQGTKLGVVDSQQTLWTSLKRSRILQHPSVMSSGALSSSE